MYATIALLVALVTVFLYLVKKKQSYWESRGVKQRTIGAIRGLADFVALTTGKMSIGEYYRSIYLAHPDEPYVGIYEFVRPVFIVLDQSVAERILVKDFGYFVDRLPTVEEVPNKNPLDLGLFSLTGNKWRAVRQKLVPTFTTGKLKVMLKTMSKCASIASEDLIDGEECQIMRVTGKYATDILGSCVFGMDPTELSHPDSKFRMYSKKVFTFTTRQMLKSMIINNFPWLAKKLNLSFFDQECTDYFCSIVKKIFDGRIDSNDGNDNFVRLLMQLKSEGSIQIRPKDVNEEDDYLKVKDDAPQVKIEMTDKLLYGQALQFLTAGLEGISLAITYLVHELSRDQAIQERLRDEIGAVLQESVGELSYETLKKMTLLHNCVMEVLRKYPTGMALFRLCIKDYPLKETGATLEAGTQVIIPIWAYHNDPKFFPDPEKFDPERFDDPKGLPPCTFMPFGDGPRMCIAMRFALLEVKIGVVTLLRRYRFESSPKTRMPLEFNKRDFLMSPLHPIYVRAIKI